MYLDTTKIISLSCLYCNLQLLYQKEANQSLVQNQDLNCFSVAVCVHSIYEIPIDNIPLFHQN